MYKVSPRTRHSHLRIQKYNNYDLAQDWSQVVQGISHHLQVPLKAKPRFRGRGRDGRGVPLRHPLHVSLSLVPPSTKTVTGGGGGQGGGGKARSEDCRGGMRAVPHCHKVAATRKTANFSQGCGSVAQRSASF